jgi:hypothetical protein
VFYDGNIANNSIQPQIVIKNSGAQPVNVSDLQIEYYTYDASAILSNLRADIYNFSINSAYTSGVTAAFSRLSSVAGNSSRKADVLARFTLPAGTLGANQSIAFSLHLFVSDCFYISSVFFKSLCNVCLFSRKPQNKILYKCNYCLILHM